MAFSAEAASSAGTSSPGCSSAGVSSSPGASPVGCFSCLSANSAQTQTSVSSSYSRTITEEASTNNCVPSDITQPAKTLPFGASGSAGLAISSPAEAFWASLLYAVWLRTRLALTNSSCAFCTNNFCTAPYQQTTAIIAGRMMSRGAANRWSIDCRQL